MGSISFPLPVTSSVKGFTSLKQQQKAAPSVAVKVRTCRAVKVEKVKAAKYGPVGPRAPDADPGAPGYPDTIFYPGKEAWGWSKPPPKTSLPEPETAQVWKLNVIEFAHWASFPLGFYIAWIIFADSETYAQAVGKEGVFFLILGTLTQVFGGGTANLMHEYEGWQVAEFRNPLKTDFKNSAYNNALLRSVTYQLLLGFQTLGLLFFTLGIFGLNRWTIPLGVVSVFIAFVGPRNPHADMKLYIQPVFPVPVSLLVTLIVTAIITLVAYAHLFQDPMYDYLYDHFHLYSHVLAVVLSILPPLLSGAGGALEGIFAESTFNQWWHLASFTVLLIGLGLNGPLYWQLSEYLAR